MPVFETPVLILALVAALAYLLGAVPFGIVISRAFGLADPRTVGSGNIGATNVLRSGSKPAAALTVLLDGAKGGIAVLIAGAIVGEDAAQIAALSAFLGHLYPVWLGFKGGKGVATFLGTVLALSLPIGIAACALWLATFAIFRISSLAGIIASALTPVAALLLGHGDKTVILAAMALFVWWRHRTNITRILNGTEPKVGRKKPPQDTA
ncbi:glycerol-3-phosphate 1-O-acyltransferase PlsY [Boseongicola aestuarii]|jgi:glycerol-3-phosphate acyltransferase PlsY|uniref:Glycerol-3-phosphate acyltransferase n=1 Tax=Boseongicola aestuarii TaxID=1470561 RepID=A0A238IXR3_9RHOB|nr:glycerol-3-phosphate 1-O-acyltransferase PlsY [Boseongicola aestuarii]SMX23176.1 Glycerol-3-phosphate acyltransferase [Boseongicola aestuarii]